MTAPPCDHTCVARSFKRVMFGANFARGVTVKPAESDGQMTVKTPTVDEVEADHIGPHLR